MATSPSNVDAGAKQTSTNAFSARPVQERAMVLGRAVPGDSLTRLFVRPYTGSLDNTAPEPFYTNSVLAAEAYRQALIAVRGAYAKDFKDTPCEEERLDFTRVESGGVSSVNGWSEVWEFQVCAVGYDVQIDFLPTRNVRRPKISIPEGGVKRRDGS